MDGKHTTLKEPKICVRCVMSWPDDPDITFDERGICNHCRFVLSKHNEMKAVLLTRPWTIYEIKKVGKNNKYDCLLGLSGGVDSSLVLHYLVEQGLRPLAFSVDNGWNTPESDENIMRLVETLKVPFYRYTIDIPKFKALQKAFIKSGTANIEIPTDHVLMAATYEMANKYGIKHIISGGNWATESIMPPAWGYQARDLRYIKSVHRLFTGERLRGLPTVSLLKYIYYRFIKGIKIVNFLDYYEYNRDEAKKLLAKKYGWKDYGEKHCESKFTKWFQDVWLPLFGIDKRKAHYSSLINSGQMKREEAVNLLKIKPEIKWAPDEILGGLESVTKRNYKDYPNSEWAWNLLSKVYGIFKRKI